MTDDTIRLERLGARVADELGSGPSEERKAVQRRAFLAAAQRVEVRRGDGRRLVLTGLAAAAAVALMAAGAALLLGRDAAPLPFWVGEQRTAGTEGSWVESDVAQKLPIRFRNGSRLELGGDTAVRIVSSNTERVSVEMGRGSLAADIKRSGETAWDVNAGPYQVSVLGTAFTVDWDAARSGLVVSVSRGVVHVRGGHLSEYGIRLAAGKRLVAGGRGERVAVESIGEPAAAIPTESRQKMGVGAAPAAAEAAPVAPTAPSGAGAKGSAPAARGKSAVSGSDWRSFYAKRDYAASIAAAEAEGIDVLLGRLALDDLWDLANASRFAHRSDVARRSLLAVRARFSGTVRAATAAFLLGRGELDDRGSPEIARGWFETYLRESGDGPLAEESLGRLIEACDKSGSVEDARRYAERYLSRYQDGLFAVLAKSVLAR